MSPRVNNFLKSGNSVDKSPVTKEETSDEDIKFKNVMKLDGYSLNVPPEKDKQENIDKDDNQKCLDQINSDNIYLNKYDESEKEKNIDGIQEVKEEEDNDGLKGKEEIEKNIIKQEDNSDQNILLHDKQKLICHVPCHEEESTESDKINPNKELESHNISENKINNITEDKNLKNESIGVKLVIVNDDDEDQKVSISDEESEEENEDD